MSSGNVVYVEDIVKEWADENGLDVRIGHPNGPAVGQAMGEGQGPMVTEARVDPKEVQKRVDEYNAKGAVDANEQCAGTKAPWPKELAMQFRFSGLDEAVVKMEALVALLKEAKDLRNELFYFQP